jgi:hypothetical protein
MIDDDLGRDAPPMPGQDPIELLSVPCNVKRVVLHGNERTKRTLIEAELAKAVAANTHKDLAIELSLAAQRLEELDIFKSALCEVCLSTLQGLCRARQTRQTVCTKSARESERDTLGGFVRSPSWFPERAARPNQLIEIAAFYISPCACRWTWLPGEMLMTSRCVSEPTSR